MWRLAVLGLFALSGPLAINAIERHNQVDIDKMLDVSVSIRSISHVTVDKYGDSVWESQSGSGFLVSTENCELWTNHHVVADAAVIEVFPRGWKQASGIPATVIRATARSDIAILKLDHCDEIAPAIIGNSDLVRPGDETFVVGNPLGRNPDSISRGIISHTHRYKDGNIPYLQTDAAINPGNSGGALFNRAGEVIGVSTAIETLKNNLGGGSGNVGLGFAAPINLVKRVASELHRGTPSWGDAGLSNIISSLTADEAEIFRVPDGNAALVVTETPNDGASAGKLFAHDVIYRINQIGISDPLQSMRMINTQGEKGDTMTLDLLRAGKTERVQITLGEGWKAEQVPAADNYDGYLGMSLEMWAGEDGDRGLFKRPVITKVHSLGPAHKAQIASSQKTMIIKGPYFVPYILDVKTVIGVAYQGGYFPVSSVPEVEKFAEKAFQSGEPLLLEIEIWARSKPGSPGAILEHRQTAFFKLLPELSAISRDYRQMLHPLESASRGDDLGVATEGG